MICLLWGRSLSFWPSCDYCWYAALSDVPFRGDCALDGWHEEFCGQKEPRGSMVWTGDTSTVAETQSHHRFFLKDSVLKFLVENHSYSFHSSLPVFKCPNVVHNWSERHFPALTWSIAQNWNSKTRGIQRAESNSEFTTYSMALWW